MIGENSAYHLLHLQPHIAQQYPETYIIDRQGIVRRKFIGPVNWTQPEIVSYLNRM